MATDEAADRELLARAMAWGAWKRAMVGLEAEYQEPDTDWVERMFPEYLLNAGDALTALSRKSRVAVDRDAVIEARVWNEAADIIEEREGGFYGASSAKEMQMQQFRIEATVKLVEIFREKAEALKSAAPQSPAKET